MLNPGNDNRLEQLSREAADGFTPPGKPSWDKMEQELDKVLPVAEKKRRRFIFGWLFPVLVTGAGLLWISQRNNKTTEQPIITKKNIDIKTPDSKNSIELNTEKNISSSSNASKNEPILNEVKKQVMPAVISSTTKTITTKPISVVKEGQKKTDHAVLLNKEIEQGLISNPITQAIIPTTSITDQQKNIPATNTIKPTIDSGSGSIQTGIMEKADTVRTDLSDSTKPVDVSNADTIVKKNKCPKKQIQYCIACRY